MKWLFFSLVLTYTKLTLTTRTTWLIPRERGSLCLSKNCPNSWCFYLTYRSIFRYCTKPHSRVLSYIVAVHECREQLITESKLIKTSCVLSIFIDRRPSILKVTLSSRGSKYHRSLVIDSVTRQSSTASGNQQLPVYTFQVNWYFRYSGTVGRAWPLVTAWRHRLGLYVMLVD